MYTVYNIKHLLTYSILYHTLEMYDEGFTH